MSMIVRDDKVVELAAVVGSVIFHLFYDIVVTIINLL